MLTVLDEIDGSYYLDLILSPEEVKLLTKNEMICDSINIKHRQFYLAVRLKGEWDDEEAE